MPARRPSILKGIAHNRTLRHVQGLGERIAEQDISSIRPLRGQARDILRAAERAYTAAEARLALPLIGGAPIDAPVQSDWTHRPELWSSPVRPAGIAAPRNRARLGAEATIHHDCRLSEITFRQLRNHRPEDIAPFGVVLEVLRFEGSFLSLAIDIPQDGLSGLQKRHIVRFAAHLDYENPIEIFARLNIKHGPNTEQLVRDFPLGDNDLATEWDLAFVEMNEKRIEAAWIDLIFGGPALNRIDIRDMTLSRRPRADF